MAFWANSIARDSDLRLCDTAGHGILRTTGLIAISAHDPDELERAVADIEQAAIQASCETRRLWGQQAQAFSAAALPLCRQVRGFVRVSSVPSDRVSPQGKCEDNQ